MKLITAIIRPDKLDDVTHAVTEAGARGLTATRVSGFGQQYGHVVKVAGVRHQAALLPKTRVDIVARDEDVDAIARAIVKTVSTPAIGDGKIWVASLDAVIRARTGERDNDAI